ncbi:unnamed protein product [Closterium sp. Yama58-4]|nr:unnamed protein product [Closterium sp. Yama58-4]
MEEHFVLRLPPSLASRMDRVLREDPAAAADAAMELFFQADGRTGSFVMGGECFSASLLDLPAVVESWKTYDDNSLVKTADVGQMIVVREPSEAERPIEGPESRNGLTPPMRDVRRRRFRREPDLNPEIVEEVEGELRGIMAGGAAKDVDIPLRTLSLTLPPHTLSYPPSAHSLLTSLPTLSYPLSAHSLLTSMAEAGPLIAALEVLKSKQPSELFVIGLALIGLLWLFSGLLSFLNGIWILFLRPAKNLRRYGSWAIVTGCTDGIGKGFAKELAKRKINVILVSRTQEKLEAVASELSSKYKYLHEVEDKLISDLININVEPVVRLTKIVIPNMLKRKRGAIVNIGSGVATVIPSDPLYSVYAGTKAFVDQFSRSINMEYASKGIDVQVQAPLFVATKMSKIRHASLTCPSPDLYAKHGANWVGQEVRVTPYWAHGVMWGIIYRFPEGLFNIIRLGQNVDIRKRALAKIARQQKQQ